MRERFLLRKTYRFFARLGAMPQEEREAFIKRLKANPGHASKIGETFAVWLDRLDDEEKAELLARVFELYARGEIDFDRSARFAAVIERAHLPYLLHLRKDGYNLYRDDVKSHLLALGLVRMTAHQKDVERERKLDRSPRGDIDLVKMELNEDGRIFQSLVL